MNPSLLNSIYFKASEKNISNLPDLISYYLNKLYMYYFGILEDNNIKNVNERIKYKKYLPSGKHYIDTQDAGLFFINFLLDSPQYQKQIEKLDDIFLEHCKLPNKEECLEQVKHLFKELASESLDKNEVIEKISKLDFSPHENDYLDEDDDLFVL